MRTQNSHDKAQQGCRGQRDNRQHQLASSEDYKRCPAFIAHRWIRKNHGHIKLCFGDLARSMELDLRTLQRVFRAAYGISMKNYATSERIRFIREAFSTTPCMKLSALASELGYESDKAFIRFLSQHPVIRRRPNSVEMTTPNMRKISA